jgi:hypothetical protein
VLPIREGDRGPAVEDVQRRLLLLGADLGASGVDGVFLGATLAAVTVFQHLHRLDEDGLVGPQTWAALVDATFTLGDRLLYLRFPYLHGADVRSLQGALNALGFSCGEPDGIFGAFTEGAVREFQGNAGIVADGIVGPDTVRAVGNLRHAWGERATEAPRGLRAASARSAEVLASVDVVLDPLDEQGTALAERVANLALASDAHSRVRVAPGGTARFAIAVGIAPGPDALDAARPRLAEAVASAFKAAGAEGVRVEVALGRSAGDDRELQRIAVALLDGLCLGLAGS